MSDYKTYETSSGGMVTASGLDQVFQSYAPSLVGKTELFLHLLDLRGGWSNFPCDKDSPAYTSHIQAGQPVDGYGIPIYIQIVRQGVDEFAITYYSYVAASAGNWYVAYGGCTKLGFAQSAMAPVLDKAKESIRYQVLNPTYLADPQYLVLRQKMYDLRWTTAFKGAGQLPVDNLLDVVTGTHMHTALVQGGGLHGFMTRLLSVSDQASVVVPDWTSVSPATMQDRLTAAYVDLAQYQISQKGSEVILRPYGDVVIMHMEMPGVGGDAGVFAYFDLFKTMQVPRPPLELEAELRGRGHADLADKIAALNGTGTLEDYFEGCEVDPHKYGHIGGGGFFATTIGQIVMGIVAVGATIVTGGAAGPYAAAAVAAGVTAVEQSVGTGRINPAVVGVAGAATVIGGTLGPNLGPGLTSVTGLPASVATPVASGALAASLSAGSQAALTGKVDPITVAISAGGAAAGSIATSAISSLSSPAPLPTSSDMSVTGTSPADTMIADSTKGGVTPMLGQDDSGVIPTPTDYVPDASVMAEGAASYQERLGADYVASTKADLQGSLGQAIVTDTSANLPAAQAAAGVGDTSGLWGSAIGSALKTLATGLLRDVSGVIKTSTGGPGSALPGSHPVIATGAQAPAAGTVVLPVIGAVPGWVAIAGVGMIAYLMMRR